ncbi:hypothetical protein LTR22_010012 [Elasticomyces elasticus]|nr:hypothetical protein LTR22_010012 [Elasticomyces elasticus]KAK5752058.1 hypothetical protein LTS12_017820 [Elasticomyces elasticus]
MHFTLVFLALASTALTSPLATNPPHPTCAPVSAVLSALHGYNAASAFCSTFIGISTHTATTTSIASGRKTTTTTLTTGTSVVVGNTVTSTLPLQTVTGSTSVVLSTADAVTITASASVILSTDVVTVVDKHVEAHHDLFSEDQQPRSIYDRQVHDQEVHVRDPITTQVLCKCGLVHRSCLSLSAPTTTLTVLATSTYTVVQTSDVAALTTSTPTSYVTPFTTLTPVSTSITTPTTTLYPVTTFTPNTTSIETSTTTVIVGQTTGTPSVVLASPTAIFGDAGGNSPSDYDDHSATVEIPFAIEIYGVSSSSIVVSINGFVGLTNDPGVDFDNVPLPQSNNQDVQGLPNTAVCPFWDDLYVYADTPQGVYYEVDGAAPARNISFEWYTSHYGDPTQYYHFIATFEEANPGATTFTYYEISDHGSSATVGMQSIQAGQSTQYSYNNGDITPGLELTYDDGSNAFEVSNSVSCV